MEKIIQMLEEMEKWVQDFPPIEQPQRFGNKAFRDWFARLSEVSSIFVFLFFCALKLLFLGSF